MDRKVEERLPEIVEERLQEAYDAIRNGEVKQMGKTERKQKRGYRRWMSVAAALALIVAVPSAVFAAAVYFQKNTQQEADRLTYEFELNYELVPGEYQVTPEYIPDGMAEQGDGKYCGEEDVWITVMPIYTMAELERRTDRLWWKISGRWSIRF